ncbi:MAG: hypothetical protein J0H99_28255 [Rhodospirillales bacterium]|nr:hypothetical protein [Rhodospirillales bacterium]
MLVLSLLALAPAARAQMPGGGPPAVGIARVEHTAITETLEGAGYDVSDYYSEFDPATDSRNFRLLMSSSVAEILGVPVMRSLRDAAPNLRCQIDIFVTAGLLRRLQDFDRIAKSNG